MHLPFFRRRRARHDLRNGQETIRSIFSKFRRIQKLNTGILELMAEMDRALGGEYIFDRAFLESSVHKLGDSVYQVVYCLNALSENKYVALFERFQSVKDILDDILRGGAGPLASSLTIPYPALGWEMEPLVGMMNICLAEARHRYALRAPDGFVVTAAGCKAFMEANGFSKDYCLERDSNSLKEAFAGAAIPLDLEKAVEREMHALQGRCPEAIRLSVRPCPTEAHSMEPFPNGIDNISPGELLSLCKLALAGYASQAAAWVERDLRVALAVHEAMPVSLIGSISPHRLPGSNFEAFSITAAPVQDPEAVETYWVNSSPPFDLLQSDILGKDPALHPEHTARALTSRHKGFYAGSGWAGPGFLKTVAQSAATIEKMMGASFEMQWGRDESERPVILGISQVCETMEQSHLSADLFDILQGRDILLKGGETAQAGISYGKIVHVSENTPAAGVPFGAIAVARKATPQLSLILDRVSALITEIGTPGGHLATIARELRVPAIFGASGALDILGEGTDVTVDAGDRVIYSGRIDPLLSYRASGADLCPTEPEYIVLRSLLRWIRKLNLIDPEDDNFSIENCSTYHDIIHFAHERSIEELIHIQEHANLVNSVPARRLEVDFPLHIYVIDVEEDDPERVPDARQDTQVHSEPLRAFLQGLAFKALWEDNPNPSISLQDIFSGLDRTEATLAGPPEHTGRNLAIIARNYMNLSLHLGYHSSIIDAYLDENPGRNTISFRFAGGFADARRRGRRVALIKNILDKMGFKTTVKGDLLSGYLRWTTKEESTQALSTLGSLTGFTRRLDVSMVSEGSIEDMLRLFTSKTSKDSR